MVIGMLLQTFLSFYRMPGAFRRLGLSGQIAMVKICANSKRTINGACFATQPSESFSEIGGKADISVVFKRLIQMSGALRCRG
jgi:hypothetical protein